MNQSKDFFLITLSLNSRAIVRNPSILLLDDIAPPNKIEDDAFQVVKIFLKKGLLKQGRDKISVSLQKKSSSEYFGKI